MAAYPPFNPYGGIPYGQMPPQQMMYAQPQTPQASISARLVTSRDEAMSAQIPFDAAAINVFYCPSAEEIYIKRFNPQTGGAIFDVYQSAARHQPHQEQSYAPMSAVTALEQRVSELAEAVGAMQARKAQRGARADE